jgi:hypothetical protein
VRTSSVIPGEDNRVEGIFRPNAGQVLRGQNPTKLQIGFMAATYANVFDGADNTGFRPDFGELQLGSTKTAETFMTDHTSNGNALHIFVSFEVKSVQVEITITRKQTWLEVTCIIHTDNILLWTETLTF